MFDHLKRLSAVKSGSGIKFLSPAVFPGNHCPMRIASVIVEDIRGLSSLLVGTPECATHSRLFSPLPEGRNGELHWLYVIDSNEVVFGCREGVADALRKMDRAGAEAILIIGTCIPELIGEDMEGLIHEIQPELKAQVTFVMLGQFKNVSYPPGSWKTMEAMASLMDRCETDSRRINVLGRSPFEEHIPEPAVTGYLESKELKLRYLAPGASLDDFRQAPDAALNVVLSPFAQPLAVRMEREFGVPFIALHDKYAPSDIDRAYGDIARAAGYEPDGRFDEEKRQAENIQAKAEERLKGMSFVFSQRIDMPVPLAAYLTEIGMVPLLLHIEEYYSADSAHTRKIKDAGYDPPVCRITNIAEDEKLIKELNPDICMGYFLKTDMKYVPDMYDFYGQTGYGRTVNILKRILEVTGE
ncbi:nitrogenase component 1 [Seleniivibrio woodruffii]|uniref:nitrogenase component 1 n=1 Tax=Seleniivibrio woodruffii TaxID=1078050 RepID=UPI0026ECE342|nr:nitrogenase component 1 [Seleniivibrio woodruffii]